MFNSRKAIIRTKYHFASFNCLELEGLEIAADDEDDADQAIVGGTYWKYYIKDLLHLLIMIMIIVAIITVFEKQY